ncbi:hypothetical protein COU79_04945 [Candidatus Peregrinibacteria bacterium CG10_big_fil_rev_8_21_14_0_10_54_7]|nr:MAG: hypothetical protein COU79_04945 [Candidatus Peregrinibacteria bacterium CG10_big_fil_rev_8_21_14_0_10_54_7]
MPLSLIPEIKAWAQQKKGGHTKHAEYLVERTRGEHLQPKVIADLGCGTMVVTRRIAGLLRDADVYGYDVQDHAAKRHDDPANLHYSVIEPFTFGQQEPKADIVNLGGVIHHVDQKDELRFLQDVHAGMTDGPDSRLFVHEHTLSAHPWRRRMETVCLRTVEFLINEAAEGMLTQYNFYTRERLLALLRNAEFEVLDHEDVGTRLVTLPSLNTNTVYWCRKK